MCWCSRRYLLLVPLCLMSLTERRLRFAGFAHWTSGDKGGFGQDPGVTSHTSEPHPPPLRCHSPLPAVSPVGSIPVLTQLHHC